MKYATIGTSTITQNMIEGAQETGLWELGGVYSRSMDRARKFADKYGAQEAYDSLSALAASEIGAVYVASPNSLHYEQSKFLLNCGKHVICEKPLTVVPAQAEELMDLARAKKIVYMEAIMMMHQPQRNLLRDALAQIGTVTSVHFDFSQLSSRYPALLRGELPNIFNPAFAAGCIMDLGIYCVYPALFLFGTPDRVETHATLLPSGVDGTFTSVFSYPGMQLTITASKTGQDRCGSQILGDKGTISIRLIHHLTDIVCARADGTRETLLGDVEKKHLMANEMKDFYRHITDPAGSAEEYRYAQRLSLEVSRVMQTMRAQAGLPF